MNYSRYYKLTGSTYLNVEEKMAGKKFDQEKHLRTQDRLRIARTARLQEKHKERQREQEQQLRAKYEAAMAEKRAREAEQAAAD